MKQDVARVDPRAKKATSAGTVDAAAGADAVSVGLEAGRTWMFPRPTTPRRGSSGDSRVSGSPT
jgi:hypothetical protein